MAHRRIAIVTESFYPAVDGATTTVKHVADRLIDTGHEVMIVAPEPGLLTYRRSRVARIRALDRPGSQVRSALASFDPDLVQVHSPGALGRKALKHARQWGAVTLTVQQSPLRDLTADYWKAKVADRSDLVLTTCRWMRDELGELGVDAPVWRPGVDTDAFAPHLRDDWLHGRWARARSPEGPLVVVGFVGSLHRSHGVRRLVEAAQVRGTRLVVIGDGPQRDWLVERLPGARFTGALGTGDLAVALASLDVLVHPGEELTCGHALREGAASGVPVVAPRAGGVTDVVRHLETGLLYDPRQERGLRNALAAVVGDRHRALLGEHARIAARQRSWTAAVDELVARHHATLGVSRGHAA